MSRIILSRNDDGTERVVAGWDGSMNTYFAQILLPGEREGEAEWYTGYAYNEHLTIESLVRDAGHEVRGLVLGNAKAIRLLYSHATDGNDVSRVIIDLTKEDSGPEK